MHCAGEDRKINALPNRNPHRRAQRNSMHVTLVQVRVKPEHVADFIEASRANHQASLRGPGNLRFDVLQDASDPARVILYEAYRSTDAATTHKKTAHKQAWRE